MGLKINREDVVNRGSSVSKSTGLIIILAAIVAGVLLLNVITSFTMNQKVEIVTLVTSVPADGRITEANMQKAEMTKHEFESRGTYNSSSGKVKRAVVLWEERETIKDTYASYYLRQGTPIYWDSLSKETPKQYSYLYKMDGELLKISVEADQFGRMLVPGDRINVRASYSENKYNLMTYSEYDVSKLTGVGDNAEFIKQDIIFNNASVLDILNDEGESIFDIYYDLMALSGHEQRELVATEEFIESVQPREILLNVTPEEADMYMYIQSKGPTYMMTLLPRSSSNLISEMLNDLQIGFARSK